MKRFLSITILCLLCLSNLAACSKGSPYIVYLTQDTENSVFSDSCPRLNDIGETTENVAPENASISIGDQTMSVKHTANINDGMRSWSVYKNGDDSVEYRKRTDSDSFSIAADHAENKILLKKPDSRQLSEQTLIDMGKEYISQYIGDIDYNKYVYKIRTYYTEHYENGASGKEVGGFYLPTDGTEEVRSYTIEYTEYCNDLATSDNIRFTFDKNGDLNYVYYSHDDVDWSSADFGDDKINKSVDAFINTYTTKKISSYNISSKVLTLYQGKIKLLVTADLKIDANGSEYTVPCLMLLSAEAIDRK